MGLSYALTSALSGLRASQTGLQLVSTNIANVQTPGYTKKSAVLDTNVVAGRSAGVRVTQIQREIDTYVQRQLRTESSGLSFSGITAGYLNQLQQVFGTPGGEMSLDSLVGGFTNSLDALATTPSSQSARADVINQARLMTQSLNSMSRDIQAMRQDADRGLQDTVARANAALQGIASINARITSVPSNGEVPPDYLDQRDRYLSDLAEVMDIRVMDNGHDISIFTTGGAALFTGGFPSSLEFEGSTAMSPEALYSEDPAERRLGTVVVYTPNGAPVDLLKDDRLRSGEMKAYAELRDNILVEAQTQLDELAASMAEALGTHQVASTANGTGFDLDLSNLQAGNKISLTYQEPPGGPTRTVTFVRVNDPDALPLANDVTADPNDTVYGIDFSGGLGTVAAQMQAALGADFSVSNAGNTFTFDAATANVDVTGASARVTATTFQNDGLAIPFFVDGGAAGAVYTGSLDGLGQRLGFAGRIQINPALTNDPALLVNYQTSMMSGDASRATFMRDALENAQIQFRRDTGLGGANSPFTGSIADFARGAVESQARNADLSARVHEGQQVVVTSLQDRFVEKSGVDVDEEMAKLLQLQTAYAANARVISTVKEMMDVLMAM
jgi:flagellar hook-associated protein 1 FlgK